MITYLGINLESINLASHIHPIFAPVPKSISAALASTDSEKWKNAMVVEINALESNHTWDVVSLPPGKSALGCKWVFALRPDSSGTLTRFKARLVARGDLQLDHEFHVTFAPVAKFCSLKILLSIAAFHDLEIDQGDFDSAFVNGLLDEEIYMSQPPGFTSGDAHHVLRLRKSLYGLKQAARVWYQTLDSPLKQFQFRRVVVDYGVWVQHKTTTLILAHVDDMILVGSRSVLDTLKPKSMPCMPLKTLVLLLFSWVLGSLATEPNIVSTSTRDNMHLPCSTSSMSYVPLPPHCFLWFFPLLHPHSMLLLTKALLDLYSIWLSEPDLILPMLSLSWPSFHPLLRLLIGLQFAALWLIYMVLLTIVFF